MVPDGSFQRLPVHNHKITECSPMPVVQYRNYNDLPPSTGNSIPVMNEASSLARKAVALATSSGVANRPKGMLDRMLLLFSGVSIPPRIRGILAMY